MLNEEDRLKRLNRWQWIKRGYGRGLKDFTIIYPKPPAHSAHRFKWRDE